MTYTQRELAENRTHGMAQTQEGLIVTLDVPQTIYVAETVLYSIMTIL